MTAYQKFDLQFDDAPPMPAKQKFDLQFDAADTAPPIVAQKEGSQLQPDPVSGPAPTKKDIPLWHSIAAGATNAMGWADEFLGGLNAIYPADPGVDFGPQAARKNYNEMQQGQEAVSHEYRDAHPWGFGVGDAATSSAALGAAGLATPKTFGEAVVQGAKLGMVGGAGESKGNLTSADKALELVNDTSEGGLVGGAAGGAGYGIVKGVVGAGGWAADQARRFLGRPTSKLAQQIGSEVGPEAFAAGQKLVDESGVPLNLAQRTQSPTLLNMQEQLRKMPGGAAQLAEQQAAASEKLAQGIRDVIDSPLGPAETTKRVATLARKMDLESLGKRAARAAIDFGRVDELSGDARLFSQKNYLGALDKLIERYTSDSGVDAPLVKYLTGLKDVYMENTGGTGLSTARSLQNDLRTWGAKAAGVERLFDLSPQHGRDISKTLLAALRADLDDAATQAGQMGEAGKALLEARSNYQAASDAHKALKDQLLLASVKKMSGNNPETFPAMLLRPGQISDQMVSRTMGTVSAMDADAARGLRAAALDTFLKRAAPKATSALGELDAPLSPSKLVDMWSANESRMKALFTGDPAGLAKAQQLVEAAKRLSAYGESQPMNQWWANTLRRPWYKPSMLGGAGIGGALLTGHPVAAGAMAGGSLLTRQLAKLAQSMTTRNLSKLLTDPESATTLLRLMEPKAGMTIAQATRAATLLLNEIEQGRIEEKNP